MDPERGWPVESRQQMTVMAATAIAADAFSTGALVAGHAPSGIRAIASTSHPFRS
jgi:thiamine biosynthesis lipoprotein ApbE